MYKLSFSSLFGGDSYQDATKIVIAKKELPKLTATVNNHVEQLLIAILLQAFNSFKGDIVTDIEESIDIGNDTLSFDNSDAFEFLKIFLWKPFYEVKDNQLIDIRQIIFRYFEESGHEYEN